jgi:hypothetical protein
VYSLKYDTNIIPLVSATRNTFLLPVMNNNEMMAVRNSEVGITVVIYCSVLKLYVDLYLHVRWVPCNRGMPRPQVVDGRKASRYRG